MTPEEKNTWIYAGISLVAYLVYVAIVVQRSRGVPVADVKYIGPLIWTFVAMMVAMIVGRIAVRMIWRGEPLLPDERDRAIDRYAYRIGYGIGGLGSLAGMILAMARADQFWIANTIYLGCFVSGFVGSVIKIVAYRRGLAE